MVANTNQVTKFDELMANAHSLIHRGLRSPQQIEVLNRALQTFKEIPSPSLKKMVRKRVYPGKFGNRCSGCGGHIDDGGHCPGGTDHDNQIPGACGKEILVGE